MDKFWSFIFFLGIFFIFFLPAIDTDLGWHLRYGEYFWQTRKFMTHNQLTLLLQDYQWPNSYTLYQIITFLILKLTGFYGFSSFYSLTFVLAFFILYLYFKKSLYKTVFSFLLVTPFSWHVFNLGWRAQVFSFLGLILVFYLLKASKKTPRKSFFLPPLFFFWVNLHGAFILGLTIYTIFLLIQLIKLLKKQIHFGYFAILLLNFFLSGFATLINPYKFRVWWEAWHHLKVPMEKLIAEWVPPRPSTSLFIILNFTLCLLIVSFSKKSFWQGFLFLCLTIFFYLSLSARRNVPFFLLTSGLIISNSSFLTEWEENLNFQGLHKVFIGLIFIWGVFLEFPKTVLANASWENYCESRTSFPFPCEAVEFLKQKQIKGNFYNTYEWGGFFDWQLKDSKFFVDGRMPAWPHPSGKSPYTIYLEILQTRPGWQETLEKYGINYLFIQNNNALDLELKKKPHQYPWQEIYRDNKAVIYQKI